MAFRDDRLRAILEIKGLLTKSAVYHKTALSYPQIRRYTAQRGTRDFGLPNVETLAVLAIKLEIDADYLLDSDPRYEAMTAVQAAAHMSLDRYVVLEAGGGRSISDEDLLSLRLTATNHSQPPFWISDWKREHESVRLHRLAAAPTTQAVPKPSG